MYLIVFAVLFISTVITFLIKTSQKKIYLLFSLSNIRFLFFRYGQGTDYFGYEWIFERCNSINDVITNRTHVDTEIGFQILCALFNGNFSVMIVFISLFEMCMLDRFIRKYSNNGVLSLLICYHTIYLTYFFSALRQGIAIAVFLGILLQLYEKKHIFTYVIITIITGTIHYASLVFLAVPFFANLKRRSIDILVVMSFFVGMISSTKVLNNALVSIPYVGVRLEPYIDGSIRWIALSERIIMFILITVAYNEKIAIIEPKEYKYLRYMYNLYEFGLCVYFVFVEFPIISSRLCIMFKALEIALVPNLIYVIKKYRIIMITGIMLISIVMTFKTINANIEDGNYKNFVNVFNYPYINIYNKNQIWEYKSHSIYDDLLD